MRGTISPVLRWNQMLRRIVSIAACFSVLLSAGCRVGPTYTVHGTDVELRYAAEASTAVYVRDAEAGDYTLQKYEGVTDISMTPSARWGIAARVQGQSSRSIAQPLCAQRVRLVQSGTQARLTFGDGDAFELQFVVGQWRDYEAGLTI